MRDIYRLALPRAAAIILVQLAVVILGVGYLDYSRGVPDLSVTVPVCTENCVPLPEGAVRAVLDADLDGRRRIEALFGTPVTFARFRRSTWPEASRTTICCT